MDAAEQEDLAGEDRGHEPLREVPDAVVVVAGEAERALHPEAEGDGTPMRNGATSMRHVK